MSLWSSLGASNHSAYERAAHDFYATDPATVHQLLDRETFAPNILEPCCGAGHIAQVLKSRGYRVVAEDLYDYGYGASGIDFLKTTQPFNGDIITNPPFKFATEFILHALELVPLYHRVAMFLRIQFLESADRYSRLWQLGNLERVYVASKRAQCARNGDFSNLNSSAACYAWFIWRKGFKGEPSIRWFNTPSA